MTESTFEFDGVPYRFTKDEGGWTLTLRRSLAPLRDEAEADMLVHRQDTLMACRVECDEDTITWHLVPGDGTVEWSEVRAMPRTDRLRALVNVGACVDLVAVGYSVLLHPENLVVDRNLRPRVAYRGIAGVMPPQGTDEQHVLRQYQALVLSTLDPKTSFTEAFDGAMTLRRGSDFERSVVATTSVADLVGYLTARYDEAAAEDAATLVRVGRRSHRVFKHATIWLGVLALAAGVAAVYSTFYRVPFQDRMLSADTQFVKGDYDGVIETLNPVDQGSLPLTQRYELAYSYLRGTNLSEDQKDAIQNNLSLSSEVDFLTYWVQVGRGDLDDALDNAKGLNDIDLILYALTLLQEQVGADTGMSGTERAERLAELQTEYDEYYEARTESVAGTDGAADQATASPTATADAEAAGSAEPTEAPAAGEEG